MCRGKEDVGMHLHTHTQTYHLKFLLTIFSSLLDGIEQTQMLHKKHKLYNKACKFVIH